MIKITEQIFQLVIVVRRAVKTMLLVVVAVAAVPGAEAWDSETATDAQPCQWSPVVRVGAHCTGAYVGSGVILTAAHCLWDSTFDNPPIPFERTNNSLDITFGEDGGQGVETIPVLGCYSHPGGEPEVQFDLTISFVGVDFGYCRLNMDGHEEFLAQIPLVPPMVPSGCARDWLSRMMRSVAPDRPLAIATGMGCEAVVEDVCVNPGIKRFSGVEIQPTFSEEKQFTITRFGDELGLMGGDSGGPLYIRLPDHTWRLIGVNHATAGGGDASVQSVSPYISWVEWHSECAVDITPCHALVPETGEYTFTGNCQEILALDPWREDEEDGWIDGCTVTRGGPSDLVDDECDGWPVGPASVFLAPSL